VALVFGVVIIVIIGAIVVVSTGYGDGLPAVESDVPPLPDGDIDGDALRSVRFSTSIRGYRMDEVDALLSRLSAQLDSASDSSGRRE
jgi:DivIVA domain-containing protein